MNSEGFQAYSFRNGLLASLASNAFPSELAAWDHGGFAAGLGGTHYGFVLEGKARLSCAAGSFDLLEGMYFSAPRECRIEGEGRGIVVTRLGFEGAFLLGGPVEERGRLAYIDGCSDSLIIPPPKLGDPCLNLLHIPPRTEQTQHTHPSLRAGVIVSGTGTCVTPAGDQALARGTVFIIPENCLHSFHTEAEALRVIAFHPDSDFGPTDENHPMVNKTIIPAAGK